MSRVDITVPIYQQKLQGNMRWTTIGLGEHTHTEWGTSAAKLRRTMVSKLRRVVEQLDPADVEELALIRGTRLHTMRLELVTPPPDKLRVSGMFPLVLEPRWLGDDRKVLVVFHPLRQDDWFAVDSVDDLPVVAPQFFRGAWAELTADDVADLELTKHALVTVAFSAHVRHVISKLAEPEDPRRGARTRPPVLETVGTNQTVRAAEDTLPLGMPRQPYRRQLQHLLGGQRRRSVIVVGPPGVGKTTLLHRWIADKLAEDDYDAHRNLDKVDNVWQVSGKRIIAGMSYLGDWEQRCIDLMRDCERRRGILWFDDLHLLGRLGRTRDSDRNLAGVFRGPVERGRLTIVGECTPEQLQRLEDDAPAFAAQLSRVFVRPTSAADTLQMMVHEGRTLERKYRCQLHPFTYRSVLEIGGALFPWTAFPGKALDILRRLADRRDRGAGDPDPLVRPSDVVRLLAAQTGLPPNLLTLDERLDIAAVRERFTQRVMGQPAAVSAACDLIVRIRAGLTDPARPFAVYLFTGPTGTGKTELAKRIAEFLFGSESRLVRLDMSEYASADAVARLIGDQFEPRGQLTQRIREQPFAVVLLDEIEKAHPTVLNLLLQLFDEGRLTDAAGDTASFNHTVVIMTSNLGARPTHPIGFGDATATVLAEISRAVREFFPPELFNRIDRVVPFSPLTEKVAEDIATKELALLLGRRGLVERNIFVYANRAVKARIVREAFDPTHGARTVKRYLEDHVGSLLADRITRGERAALQVIRIYDSDGRLRLHVEPLVERAPEPGNWALDGALDVPALRLAAHIPDALAALDAAGDTDALGRAATRVADVDSPDVVYYWDQLRERLASTRDWLAAHAPPAPAEPSADPRPVRPAPPRARPSRARLLAAIADAYFLAAAVGRVADRDAHTAWIELVRVGHGERDQTVDGGPGLLEQLTRIYGAADRLEAFAVRSASGDVVAGDGGDAGARALAAALRARPVHVVLELSGLCIRDALAGEHGCHIWRSLAAEPEIVRVDVRGGVPSPDDTPRRRIGDHLTRARAFEDALERGAEPLPDNPAGLLPTVRTLSFQPPIREHDVFPVDVEDFYLSHAATVHVRALDDLVQRLLYLRWSRRPETSP